MSSSKLANTQQISMPTISLPQESTLVIPQPEELSIPSMLAKYGVKVRDFAYESTLPPIAPVPRVPRQVQPGPRPLKRARRDPDNEDDPFTQSKSGGDSNVEGDLPRKFKHLERQLTEPDISSSQRPTHTREFHNLSLCESSIAESSRSRTPTQFQSMPPLTVYSDLSPASQPTLQCDSQESEPYVDTPVVTPNGSLQWPIVYNNAVPSSQLDQDSQADVPSHISYTQLGLEYSLPAGEPSRRDRSPLTPSCSPIAPSSPPVPTNREISGQRHPPLPHRHTQPSLQSATAPSRYYLRKRPTATAPHTPTKLHSQPRHTTATASPRQQHSFTVQSAHSRAKNQNSGNSPRTIRKNNTNDKEDLILIG